MLTVQFSSGKRPLASNSLPHSSQNTSPFLNAAFGCIPGATYSSEVLLPWITCLPHTQQITRILFFTLVSFIVHYLLLQCNRISSLPWRLSQSSQTIPTRTINTTCSSVRDSPEDSHVVPVHLLHVKQLCPSFVSVVMGLSVSVIVGDRFKKVLNLVVIPK